MLQFLTFEDSTGPLVLQAPGGCVLPAIQFYSLSAPPERLPRPSEDLGGMMGTNPYLDEEEDEEATDSNPVADARAHAAQLEKDLKAERKANAALQAQVAETLAKQREEAARFQFKELGLNDAQAALFLKANPDAEVTQEAIGAFAVEYGLAPTPPPQEQAPEPRIPAFVPVTGTPPPSGGTTIKSFKELYLANPQQALAMLNNGQVEMGRVREDGDGAVGDL